MFGWVAGEGLHSIGGRTVLIVRPERGFDRNELAEMWFSGAGRMIVFGHPQATHQDAYSEGYAAAANSPIGAA